VSESALTPEVVRHVPDYTGQRLNPKKKAVALQVAAGRDPGPICQRFNITTQTLANWRKDPLFNAEVERLQVGHEEFVMRTNEDLRTLSTTALANIAEIVTRELPLLHETDVDNGLKATDIVNMIRVQLDASKLILATQGVSPVSKQSIKAQTTNVNVNATLGDLAEKWQRKQRRAKDA